MANVTELQAAIAGVTSACLPVALPGRSPSLRLPWRWLSITRHRSVPPGSVPVPGSCPPCSPAPARCRGVRSLPISAVVCGRAAIAAPALTWASTPLPRPPGWPRCVRPCQPIASPGELAADDGSTRPPSPFNDVQHHCRCSSLRCSRAAGSVDRQPLPPRLPQFRGGPRCGAAALAGGGGQGPGARLRGTLRDPGDPGPG